MGSFHCTSNKQTFQDARKFVEALHDFIFCYVAFMHNFSFNTNNNLVTNYFESKTNLSCFPDIV